MLEASDESVENIKSKWTLESRVVQGGVTAVVARGRTRLDQRWSNIRLATRPESVTRDRRATYEG